MKISIAENIRALRKERKLTQEQLAEALGVTVGAVSKWESGASMPEISLLIEIADFFETSVDVLLGYEWHSGKISQTVGRIRALRNEKKFAEAGTEAEKALQKYPNSFEIVFNSAVLYAMKGVEQHDKRAYARALSLFERSLELISQNEDSKISEWTIKKHISEVYLGMGQVDKAIDYMKANNGDGLNNTDIGFVLATEKKEYDEAKTYLADALVDQITKIQMVTWGYVNVFINNKEYDRAVAITNWANSVFEGLKNGNTVSYLDKSQAMFHYVCALVSEMTGDKDETKRYLKLAANAAKRFDSSPDYNFNSVRFCESGSGMTAFDDFGTTAIEGINKEIQKEFAPDSYIMRTWKEINEEK